MSDSTTPVELRRLRAAGGFGAAGHGPGAPSVLSVSVEPRGPGAVVVVEGRLDATTSPVLADVLRALLESGRRPPLFRLVVDMGHVVLAGDACLAPLGAANAELSARRGRLEVRRPSRPLRRALEQLGLGGCIARPGLEVVVRLR